MSLDVWEYHKEQMAINPEYKEAYNALEPEFSVANALIKARTNAGLTQTEVATRLGVSQPAVARMESGKNISLKTIARYASAVGQPVHLDILPQ